jgi:transposase-like protein
MNRRQTIPKELRYTFEQFHKDFPDNDACLEFLKEKRFPGGVTYCEKCGQERKHYRVSGRTAYACDHCGNHIYPLAGTVFEKSTTSLRLWFYAMYLMGSTRCGISAKQIQRETGVTYKTAWRMFRQIRSLLSEPDMQLEGQTVEVDETYVGGVRKYQKGPPMAGDRKKTAVMGLAERGGRVRAVAIEQVSGPELLGNIRKFVLPSSTVFTDEYRAYDGVKHIHGMDYEHRRIKHSAGVYVEGNVHTNTIEGFWSLLKNGIRGVYHSVGKDYLQSYLNEYAFRYNRRDRGNLIFWAILERVCERACEQPVQPIAQNQTV